MRRALTVAALGALIVLALVDYRRFAAGQERAERLVHEHALAERHPQLLAEVGRHYDPVFAELRVARALLEDELDRSWIGALPAAEQLEEVERGLPRLRQARALAETAWPRRPTSWEAALVTGGAAYLELYRTRDAALISSSEEWERPLLAAQRLGRAQTGPPRFLAAAYLGNWSSLSPAQRSATAELLAQAFQDRQTYRLLIRDWLRVAPSRRQTLAPIPDSPWAWETLQEIFAEAGDLELEAMARRRRHASLHGEVERLTAGAVDVLEEGDERRARNMLLSVLTLLPRSRDFAPALQRVLELLPPGPTGAQHSAAFAAWLEWAFELCLLRECPFEPRALSRLALLSGDLPPEKRALAFLVAGDLPRAQLVERRFAQTSLDAWAAYYLLKAETLAGKGRAAEAAASLARLPATWRRQPRYWLARRQLATHARDDEGRAASDLELERLTRSSWSRSDWRQEGHSRVLDVMVANAADGLRLEVVDAPPGGALFDILWDGELVEIRRSGGSRSRLELERSVEPGLHRLELVFHTGGATAPGEAALL